jgi:hypothetical protein
MADTTPDPFADLDPLFTGPSVEDLRQQASAAANAGDYETAFARIDAVELADPSAREDCDRVRAKVRLRMADTAAETAVGGLKAASAPEHPGVVRPRVPTRRDVSQSEHRRALWTARVLKEDPYVLLAALAVHNMIGVKQTRSFGAKPERIAASLIATETGMSERKAKDAIGRAVELGFYRRVDSGKGGRGRRGSTAAAYLPTLPEWWTVR